MLIIRKDASLYSPVFSLFMSRASVSNSEPRLKRTKRQPSLETNFARLHIYFDIHFTRDVSAKTSMIKIINQIWHDCIYIKKYMTCATVRRREPRLNQDKRQPSLETNFARLHICFNIYVIRDVSEKTSTIELLKSNLARLQNI